MSEMDISTQVAELNRGAAMMDAVETDHEKLPGAAIVSRVGKELVDLGGKQLLVRAYWLVDPKHQRTVELQWYGLTDAAGNMWLP